MIVKLLNVFIKNIARRVEILKLNFRTSARIRILWSNPSRIWRFLLKLV